MRHLAFVFVSLFFCLSARADHLFNEVVLGVFRQSMAQRMPTGEKTSPKAGFGLGFKTESDPYEGFSLKLGLMYERRSVADSFSSVEYTMSMNHLDLLTYVSYQFTDFFSAFAGPQFTVLLSSECKAASGPCLMNEGGAKYFIPVSAGLDFTVLQTYGVELFYESISQEYWEMTFEKTQTYGLNLKYKF